MGLHSKTSIFEEILGNEILEYSPQVTLPGEDRFMCRGMEDTDGWVLQASIQKNKLSITILINKGFIIDRKNMPVPEMEVAKSLYSCGFGRSLYLGSPSLIEEARNIMMKCMDICEEGCYG